MSIDRSDPSLQQGMEEDEHPGPVGSYEDGGVLAMRRTAAQVVGTKAVTVSTQKVLTSMYRGVCWNRKNYRWQASLNNTGRYIYLGSYKTQEEAAAVFDRAALRLRGARARLNFDKSNYTDPKTGQLLPDPEMERLLAEAMNPELKPAKRARTCVSAITPVPQVETVQPASMGTHNGVVGAMGQGVYLGEARHSVSGNLGNAGQPCFGQPGRDARSGMKKNSLRNTMKVGGNDHGNSGHMVLDNHMVGEKRGSSAGGMGDLPPEPLQQLQQQLNLQQLQQLQSLGLQVFNAPQQQQQGMVVMMMPSALNDVGQLTSDTLNQNSLPMSSQQAWPARNIMQELGAVPMDSPPTMQQVAMNGFSNSQMLNTHDSMISMNNAAPHADKGAGQQQLQVQWTLAPQNSKDSSTQTLQMISRMPASANQQLLQLQQQAVNPLFSTMLQPSVPHTPQPLSSNNLFLPQTLQLGKPSDDGSPEAIHCAMHAAGGSARPRQTSFSDSALSNTAVWSPNGGRSWSFASSGMVSNGHPSNANMMGGGQQAWSAPGLVSLPPGFEVLAVQMSTDGQNSETATTHGFMADMAGSMGAWQERQPMLVLGGHADGAGLLMGNERTSFTNGVMLHGGTGLVPPWGIAPAMTGGSGASPGNASATTITPGAGVLLKGSPPLTMSTHMCAEAMPDTNNDMPHRTCPLLPHQQLGTDSAGQASNGKVLFLLNPQAQHQHLMISAVQPHDKTPQAVAVPPPDTPPTSKPAMQQATLPDTSPDIATAVKSASDANMRRVSLGIGSPDGPLPSAHLHVQVTESSSWGAAAVGQHVNGTDPGIRGSDAILGDVPSHTTPRQSIQPQPPCLNTQTKMLMRHDSANETKSMATCVGDTAPAQSTMMPPAGSLVLMQVMPDGQLQPVLAPANSQNSSLLHSFQLQLQQQHQVQTQSPPLQRQTHKANSSTDLPKHWDMDPKPSVPVPPSTPQDTTMAAPPNAMHTSNSTGGCGAQDALNINQTNLMMMLMGQQQHQGLPLRKLSSSAGLPPLPPAAGMRRQSDGTGLSPLAVFTMEGQQQTAQHHHTDMTSNRGSGGGSGAGSAGNTGGCITLDRSGVHTTLDRVSFCGMPVPPADEICIQQQHAAGTLGMHGKGSAMRGSAGGSENEPWTTANSSTGPAANQPNRISGTNGSMPVFNLTGGGCGMGASGGTANATLTTLTPGQMVVPRPDVWSQLPYTGSAQPLAPLRVPAGGPGPASQ